MAAAWVADSGHESAPWSVLKWGAASVGSSAAASAAPRARQLAWPKVRAMVGASAEATAKDLATGLAAESGHALALTWASASGAPMALSSAREMAGASANRWAWELGLVWGERSATALGCQYPSLSAGAKARGGPRNAKRHRSSLHR